MNIQYNLFFLKVTKSYFFLKYNIQYKKLWYKIFVTSCCFTAFSFGIMVHIALCYRMIELWKIYQNFKAVDYFVPISFDVSVLRIFFSPYKTIIYFSIHSSL